MHLRDRRTQTARNVQPVDAFLEERVAAGDRLVVAPVVGRLQPPDDRREVGENEVADRALVQQAPQADG